MCTNSWAPRIERSTWVSAAKLTTASHPSPARSTASGSAMSPTTSSTPVPSRFAGLPAYVSLSRTTTSSPPASSRLTKCDPMNPAPPVTSTRIGKGSHVSRRVGGCGGGVNRSCRTGEPGSWLRTGSSTSGRPRVAGVGLGFSCPREYPSGGEAFLEGEATPGRRRPEAAALRAGGFRIAAGRSVGRLRIEEDSRRGHWSISRRTAAPVRCWSGTSRCARALFGGCRRPTPRLRLEPSVGDGARAGPDHRPGSRASGVAQTGKTGPQPIAPQRQLRGALLAAENRDRRPRRLRAELRRRDPPHPAAEPGLFEDRLCEVGPRAVAAPRRCARSRTARRRRPARVSPPRGGRRRWGTRAGRPPPRPRRARRRAAASCGRSCGPSRRRATTSGRPTPAPRRPPRRAASCGRRRRAGPARPTRGTACPSSRRRRSRVENATSGAPSAAACAVPPTFTAAAPCGSSSAPSTFVHAAAWSTRSGAHGSGGASWRTSHAWRSSASTSSSANTSRERVAELAARARDQGAASRADRIGVGVLHRCATRGSFHGTPCSSGSLGSYSSVTW